MTADDNDKNMATPQIWTNRLLREFDGIHGKLPEECKLVQHTMDPADGVCKALFEFK